MASETGAGRDYSLTELFVLKFVLADVIIIAALLLAGPVTAVLITALLVLSFALLWYFLESDDESTAETVETAEARSAAGTEVDPVTKLQERYAAGELSEAEFEAKLERVIESNERAERAGVETDDLELEFERSN